MLERIALAALCLLVPVAASAQPVSPRDVVRLRNGGILRGTVAEVAPGLGVSIVLVTGETRRVPATEVVWVGTEPPAPVVPIVEPRRGAPSPGMVVPSPEPFATATATVPVRLATNERGATLHRVTGRSYGSATVHVNGRSGVGYSSSSSYARICAAPCTFAAPVGTHELALALPGRMPLEGNAVTIDRPGILHATYESRAGTRAVGWLLFWGGLIGGTSLTFAGLLPAVRDDVDGDTGRADLTMTLGGIGVTTISMIVSLMLTTQADTVDFQLEPR